MNRPTVFIAMQERIGREVLINWFIQTNWLIVDKACDEQSVEQCLARHRPTLAIFGCGTASATLLKSIDSEINNADCTAFLIFTKCQHLETILKAFRWGVAGLFSCEAGLTEVQEAVGAWQRGECYLCPDLRTVLKTHDVHLSACALTKYARLTKQERQVLKLIGQGLTNQQIADKLYRSVDTISNHRKSIRRKAELTGHHKSLIHYALTVHRSLLPPPPPLAY